jgi:hypothetical protein
MEIVANSLCNVEKESQIVKPPPSFLYEMWVHGENAGKMWRK